MAINDDKEPAKYRVVEEYKSPYPDPLVFRKGEVVEVGEEYTDDPEWENWFWCVGIDGVEAWVPKQFIDIEGEKGVFKRDYNAMELSVSISERLSIHEIINGFGMAEKEDGIKGWVPMKNLDIDES